MPLERMVKKIPCLHCGRSVPNRAWQMRGSRTAGVIGAKQLVRRGDGRRPEAAWAAVPRDARWCSRLDEDLVDLSDFCNSAKLVKKGSGGARRIVSFASAVGG